MRKNEHYINLNTKQHLSQVVTRITSVTLHVPLYIQQQDLHRKKYFDISSILRATKLPFLAVSYNSDNNIPCYWPGKLLQQSRNCSGYAVEYCMLLSEEALEKPYRHNGNNTCNSGTQHYPHAMFECWNPGHKPYLALLRTKMRPSGRKGPFYTLSKIYTYTFTSPLQPQI